MIDQADGPVVYVDANTFIEKLSVPSHMTILRPNETGLARLRQEFA